MEASHRSTCARVQLRLENQATVGEQKLYIYRTSGRRSTRQVSKESSEKLSRTFSF
ncbi:hypothetical protein PILCRDRAFT_813033 [Piloderma croceum F 1598]|uniref:Uncharacterized protein n=1 Tax=Piloderma croceum (strain F 1598) TaxID=765440 RepID=A0A0C3GBP4_PILCF|nr:hypothetical protein PILCRDRAFT_813033 [Piloderma croceum F 1598]